MALTNRCDTKKSILENEKKNKSKLFPPKNNHNFQVPKTSFNESEKSKFKLTNTHKEFDKQPDNQEVVLNFIWTYV